MDGFRRRLAELSGKMSGKDEKDDKKDKKNGGSKLTKPLPSNLPVYPPVPPKDEHLSDAFRALNINERPLRRQEFVGGFKHGPANPDGPARAPSSPPPVPPRFPMPSHVPHIPPPPGPLPRPPAVMIPMPTPFTDHRPSLTMLHALSAPEGTSSPHERLAPAQTPPFMLAPRPLSDDARGNLVGSGSANPSQERMKRLEVTPPMRPRAASSPPSPTSPSISASGVVRRRVSGGDDGTRCAGMTKKGERCTRQVKAAPPLNYVDPDAPVERFCFQHEKEVLAPTGFYSHKGGEDTWVKFSDFIPEYLHSDTQAALRVEMEKPRSAHDVPGYIYAFEILEPESESEPKNSDPKVKKKSDTKKLTKLDPKSTNGEETKKPPKPIQIKVGRTVNLTRRVDEWSKQCDSKEQVLRGYWPGPDGLLSEAAPDDYALQKKGSPKGQTGTETSLLRGRVRPGEKGSACHRLERLVHLELADLALHSPYKNAQFPLVAPPTASTKAKATKSRTNSIDSSVSESISAPSTPGKAKRRTPAARLRTVGAPCADCGAIHKEIFSFSRPVEGQFKGREWDLLVKPVIEKWGKFVEAYV